ncbi:morphogenetic protein [Vibrio sp. HA2012]|uniref:morphogenetic protein n=1 Tax=Vibrio sp. HA2012 TaxID=1971595 RepID=UPI000C2B6352|nr:morphogenetic protein [Vibrio sp. HA2012]PJC87798.1 morphogenetic protein [Vibrio sp. HA2012]
MKAKPMIFNTEMVKALLDGRKTVTRRPLNIPGGWELHDRKLSKITSSHPKKGKWGALVRKGVGTDFPQSNLVTAPCFVDDLIWVRETFQGPLFDQEMEREYWENKDKFNDPKYCTYAATDPKPEFYDITTERLVSRWTPSIHMPKWASRLTLRVADVRIERVKDITEEQAIKEGVTPYQDTNKPLENPHRYSFLRLWCDLYGTDNPNPYVWVIEFEVIHKNINDVLAELEAI